MQYAGGDETVGHSHEAIAVDRMAEGLADLQQIERRLTVRRQQHPDARVDIGIHRRSPVRDLRDSGDSPRLGGSPSRAADRQSHSRRAASGWRSGRWAPCSCRCWMFSASQKPSLRVMVHLTSGSSSTRLNGPFETSGISPSAHSSSPCSSTAHCGAGHAAAYAVFSGNPPRGPSQVTSSVQSSMAFSPRSASVTPSAPVLNASAFLTSKKKLAYGAAVSGTELSSPGIDVVAAP